MEQFELSITMVRTLKGAPLSCLMIMGMVKQPVTAQYLERTSGYSDKSVGSALLLLEDYGWISRNGRYAWQLANGVKQLPLMNLEIEASQVDDDPTPAKSDEQSQEGGQPEADCDKSDTNGGTRRNSESENLRVPASSSSRSLNLESNKNPPLLVNGDESENFRVPTNLTTCDEFGIREPKRSSLARLGHVTPRLIRYHCLTAQTIGLAIYRIEKNWQIKRGWVGPDESPEHVCVQTSTMQASEPTAQEIPAEAVQSWEHAKIALQSHLKRADFVTWVESACLISADLEQQIFRLRVGNSVGAEWLKTHAVQQLEAELGGKIEIEW